MSYFDLVLAVLGISSISAIYYCEDFALYIVGLIAAGVYAVVMN